MPVTVTVEHTFHEHLECLGHVYFLPNRGVSRGFPFDFFALLVDWRRLLASYCEKTNAQLHQEPYELKAQNVIL